MARGYHPDSPACQRAMATWGYSSYRPPVQPAPKPPAGTLSAVVKVVVLAALGLLLCGGLWMMLIGAFCGLPQGINKKYGKKER
jgi:hypothetical protein